MNHPPDSERAVSELFGAMVLIGVIVTGIAIIGVMLLSQPQPQKIPDVNALISSNAQTVEIHHNGGDSFLKSELQIRLDGQDKTSSFVEDGNSGWTTWSIGQSLTYNIPSGSPVPSLIQIVYTGGGISQLIASSGEGKTAGLSVQAPAVNSITPNSGTVGDTVQITNLAGSSFFSGATVKLSHAGLADIPATNVTVVSSTQITCDFDLTGSTQGAWDVVVTNFGGPSGTLVNGFTIQKPGPPTFSSVTPTSGSTAGGTFVTITGTNLIGTTSATFGGSAASGLSVVNATTITATTTSHAAQTIDVVVVTPSGTATGTGAYTYVGIPTVTGVSPTLGTILGGTSVTITGTNLTRTTAVHFGATAAATFTVNSATQITVTSPASSAAGPVDVTVTTPGGTSATSSADIYRYFVIQSFTTVGATSWTVPTGVTHAELLVVAGGGSGGSFNVNSGPGGGGAGGLIYNSSYNLTGLTNVQIYVGAGGASIPAGGGVGKNGMFSAFDKVNATGGGGGGASGSAPSNGLNGGSGGGGCYGGIGGTTISGTTNGGTFYGNAGGISGGTQLGGGGGGGAGAAGGNYNGVVGGDGGAGLAFAITGQNLFYAGGGGAWGGAAANAGTRGGIGGSGIGGNGGNRSTSTTGGVDGTGSGGGASNVSYASGAGGSGVVIIKYY